MLSCYFFFLYKRLVGNGKFYFYLIIPLIFSPLIRSRRQRISWANEAISVCTCLRFLPSSGALEMHFLCMDGGTRNINYWSEEPVCESRAPMLWEIIVVAKIMIVCATPNRSSMAKYFLWEALFLFLAWTCRFQVENVLNLSKKKWSHSRTNKIKRKFSFAYFKDNSDI